MLDCRFILSATDNIHIIIPEIHIYMITSETQFLKNRLAVSVNVDSIDDSMAESLWQDFLKVIGGNYTVV